MPPFDVLSLTLSPHARRRMTLVSQSFAFSGAATKGHLQMNSSLSPEQHPSGFQMYLQKRLLPYDKNVLHSLTRLHIHCVVVEMKTVHLGKERAVRKSGQARDMPHSEQLGCLGRALLFDGASNESRTVRSLLGKKIASYAAQDAAKGRETCLPPDEVLGSLIASKLTCYYCSKPILFHYSTSREPRQWTLDRIDNSLGHTLPNCVVCCLDCNLRRRTTDKAKYEFTTRLQLEKKAAPVNIYVDGSCSGNQNVRVKACKAGWGVVVLDADDTVELFGPVVCETNGKGFLGAEVGSNNTGELSAVCEALIYVRDMLDNCEVCVYHDSTYAVNVITGEMKAKKNKALVEKGATLLIEARMSCTVTFKHVKAHSGHQWNDLADALAKRGATGDVCDVGRWSDSL